MGGLSVDPLKLSDQSPRWVWKPGHPKGEGYWRWSGILDTWKLFIRDQVGQDDLENRDWLLPSGGVLDDTCTYLATILADPTTRRENWSGNFDFAGDVRVVVLGTGIPSKVIYRFRAEDQRVYYLVYKRYVALRGNEGINRENRIKGTSQEKLHTAWKLANKGPRKKPEWSRGSELVTQEPKYPLTSQNRPDIDQALILYRSNLGLEDQIPSFESNGLKWYFSEKILKEGTWDRFMGRTSNDQYTQPDEHNALAERSGKKT